MKKYIIYFLLFLPFYMVAQDTEIPEPVKKISVGMVPQYAITNGIRIDVDLRLNESRHWLVFAPQLYLRMSESTNYDYNSLVGFGFEFQHKMFLHDKPKPKGPYFAYGPVFNYFNVEDDGYNISPFSEYGNSYFELAEGPVHTNIFKVGGNIIFGMQTVISDFFYIDTYIGTGFRLSFDNRTSGLHKGYNDWMGDLGYSGTLLVGGVRIGISL